MRIEVHRIPDHPLAAAEVTVRLGWRHEPPSLAGITHFLEHAHYLGSRRYPEIDLEVGRYGTAIDGPTLAEATCYGFVSLREDFPNILEVLLDMVFHPRLDPEPLEREREVVLGSIASETDYAPWEWVRLKADDLAFGTDELASLGTESTLRAISREELAAWQRRFYHQGNSFLVAAGAADGEFIQELVEKAEIPAVGDLPGVQRVPQPGRVAVREMALPNSELFLSFRFSREGADLPALETLVVLLANEPLSLLYRALRVERPLAYTVAAGLRVLSDGGRLGIYVGIARPGTEGEVWDALVGLIKALREGRIPSEALDWARRLQRFKWLEATSDPERAVAWIRRRLLWGAPLQPEEASRDRVIQAARELFRAGNAYLALAGPETGWDPKSALARLPG